MDFLPATLSLQVAQVTFIALALAVARMSGMVFVMPVFQRLNLSGALKGSVALVFALPMLPFVFGAITQETWTLPQVLGLVLKEFTVGLVIGFVLGIPIWAAEIAGDVLDLQRGSSFAGLVDPGSGQESSVLSTLLALVMVAVFFAMGGLPLVLKVIYGSYTLWPMNTYLPIFSADAGKQLLGIMDDLMRMGLMLVVPLVIALLLVDFALALVARTAQHLHVFDLSLSVKNLALTVLFVMYAAFMVSYMKNNLNWFDQAGSRLEAISPAGDKLKDKK
jgi:type III secretion protein T